MNRPALEPCSARWHGTVIGVDLHGHGRTALGERDIDLVDMGNDMAEVLRRQGHQQVDVLGYSMGAGVALRLAAQHPHRVRRLALVSAGYAQDAFHPELLPMQAQVGAAMADVFLSPALVSTVLPFLDGYPPAKTWARQAGNKR